MNSVQSRNKLFKKLINIVSNTINFQIFNLSTMASVHDRIHGLCFSLRFMFIINISATLGHTFKALFYFSNAINVIQELYNSGHLNTLSSVTRKKEKGRYVFLKGGGGRLHQRRL